MPKKFTPDPNSDNTIDDSGALQRKTNTFGLAQSMGTQRDAYAKNIDDAGAARKMLKGMDPRTSYTKGK